ncbi:ArnT family glycosyltransferase [Aquabacter spiritensis]|uniref:4-amino-4-deoxy-L-arabinose transferase-like glycosyltransferase n=1 Tax=Aquabacter spiritensis TaxID=933073 RepID=A0A4R3LQ43_9HYPH|nr:glycosyltransferase family 39 protein [Aquabacter spiritensis]TCT02664.1 4-amino-4-deoxy-L-arabinose transferase-like glycosyltransferase [Aquabacter spiritensis]
MAISEPAISGRTAARPSASFFFARGLDAASATHVRASLFLVLIALVAFLPGIFTLSPIDRDEARFSQATKQMLESGNFVDIRYKEQARHKKPVGIYWLQAASVAAAEAVVGPSARTTIFFYRIPSLLAAVGAVLLTYWTALPFVARRGALLAGLMMASCVLLGVEARLAKTDAVLLFTILASLGALARAYMSRPMPVRGDLGLAAIFWTGLAAGILVKGPLAPIFVGLPFLVLALLDRSAAFMRVLMPLPGLAWCALLCLPWFVAIYYVTDGAFYEHAVGVDMLGKVAEGAEGHWGPPGTYLLAIWGTFWPAVVLVAMAVPFAWRNRREPAVRFLLASIVPCWLVFEIAVTKLPHYVLPLYPALAILTALALERGALDAVGRRLRDLRGLWPILGCILAGVMTAGFVWFGGSWGYAVAAAPLLAGALVCLFLAARRVPTAGTEAGFLLAAVGALLLYAGVYQFLLPQMRAVWISERLAAIAAEAGCPAGNIATVPYQEPSLAFLIGTDLRFTNPVAAADLLKQGGCTMAFLGANMVPLFEQRAREIGLRYKATSSIAGFTYNGGRNVVITVFRPQEATP